MMDFAFSARKLDGTDISGLLEAESVHEARAQLRQQGLFVLRLQAAARAAAEASITTNPVTSFRRRVTSHDVMMLTSQLAIMSQSGVELADAIQNLASTTANEKLRDTLNQIHEALQQGIQLSAAMRAHPTVFSEVFVSAIRAGEASGRMTDVLNRLSSILRNEERMRSAVRGALAYPAVLLLISLGVLLAVVFFVLPQFSRVFQDVGIVPPPSTAILLAVGRVIRENWFAVLATLTIAVTTGILSSRTQTFRNCLERMWFDFPLTRGAARSLITGRVFRLLGMMLSSGIPLLESLQLCARTVASSRFRTLIQTLEQEVTLGHMIGPVFSACSFLPSGAAQMIQTAERTGKLSDVLELSGSHFEDDGERQLRDRVKLLEPAVIVVMGALVGFIVASVMLPLLDFSSMAGRK